MNPVLNEQEVRALRDLVFEKPTTDKNWAGCRDGWMKPEAAAWLEERAGRQIKSGLTADHAEYADLGGAI